MAVYLEVFLYHFIYFSFFGLAMLPLVFPFPRVYTLLKNLQFWALNRLFFFQVVFWVNTVMLMYAYIFSNGNLVSMSSLMICIVSLITRASNIAAKYATFAPKLMQKYREKIIPIDELVGEFLLGKWAEQGSEMIEQETTNAMRRNGFDEAVFNFSFFEKVSDGLEAEIKKLETEIVYDSPSKVEVRADNGRIQLFYTGQVIF